MSRYKIILNPTAGKGNGQRVRPQIEALLDQYKLDYDLVETEFPEHATELARLAVNEKYDIVVAAGGDGTVNEVINGILKSRNGKKSGPALAVIPVGRGNDFAYGVNIPINVEEAVSLLAAQPRNWIDIGKVHSSDPNEFLYFGNGVGMGFDAVVGFVASKMKLTGMLSYLVAALKTIFIFYKPPSVEILLENDRFELSALMVSIMNGRRMGGGFMMAPNAKTDDGFLDLCIVREIPQMSMFGMIAKFMKGTQNSDPAVTAVQSKKIVIKALSGSLPVHADGVTVCEEGQELTIELLPKMLEIISQVDA